MTVISFFIEEWKQFAEKHQGVVEVYKTGVNPVGFGLSVWGNLSMTIPYRDSNIVFKTSEASSVKIFYDFQKDLQLNFLIYPEDYMDKIGKIFNLKKEIKVNDAQFDKQFFIQSDNEQLVESLLCEEIKSFLIENLARIANYKLDLKEDSSVLEYNAPFDESNIPLMEQILSFMKKTVDHILDYHNKNH